MTDRTVNIEMTKTIDRHEALDVVRALGLDNLRWSTHMELTIDATVGGDVIGTVTLRGTDVPSELVGVK